MIALMNQNDRFQHEFDTADELDRFERFTYRRDGEFPVRSHASRTRAKMRGRARAAARHKESPFNGANRRGRGKQWRAFC